MIEKPRSTLTDVIGALQAIDDLEGESHGIWDDAVSNLAYAHVDQERRNGYVERTYTATAKHREAMELLREAIRKLQNLR